MTDQNQMTSKQRKELSKKEFYRKFGRYWLLYGALIFTGVLSFIGGLMLPFMKPDVVVPLTWGTAGAGFFYALGFFFIGEGACFFWIERITDQDPDNTAQKITAWIMIVLSVLVSASTALATSYIIAYWVGVFDAFLAIPVWAQKYIAIAVPVMMVANAVAAIVFKSVSDEAAAERDANATIRLAENEAREARATARANWVKANAPRLAQEMGEMEAENDLDALRAKIREEKAKRNNSQPVYTYSQDTEIVRKNGSDPQTRQR
jgi:hypothetical protein